MSSKALVFAVLFLSLSLLGCVPVESSLTDNEDVTPVVAPTRLPPRPTTEATPEPPMTSVSCDQPRPSAPAAAGTAVSSRSEGTPIAMPDGAPTSLRLSSPSRVPAPQALLPIATRVDVLLEGRLRLLLGPEESGYAIVAVDLGSGRRASINEDLAFYSASLFKTWVMYEVFHQHALGLFDLSDDLVITPYYDAFGLGPRATELCQQLTVLQALEAMMSMSDNAAAVLLQDLVGAPNINSSLEALGLRDSRLTTEEIPVTAQDMALLLEFIASGKAVNRPASEEMAALMLREGFENGLRAGIPAGVPVAHKTGNWPNARHDIGIVFGPKTTYVVAILSDNRNGSLAMIEVLSRAIYESFNR